MTLELSGAGHHSPPGRGCGRRPQRRTVRQSYHGLVAPVRPNGTHTRPDLPMTEYAA
ncbi:hypothetical protein [Micromonospora avicenniae]|uniref:hypothetical protein n=1 Tax=Micromonospora avicenniae TaxID=1198245 RepID=UPI0033203391